MADKKIRTLILEDEEPAQKLMKHFVELYDEIELCGIFGDGFSGTKAINDLKPDLVFMDIQMPKITGIELIEIIEHKPVIVFTTAYDEYAVKAFELNAADYLLKPFSKERFDEAVTKALKTIAENNGEKDYSAVGEKLTEDEYLERIAIRTGNKIDIVSCSDVFYIEADGDYVKIRTEAKNFLKDKTMKYFEAKLDPNEFVRVHRSFIVNLEHIKRMEHYTKDQYMIFFNNGDKVKTSGNGYKLLKEKLKF